MFAFIRNQAHRVLFVMDRNWFALYPFDFRTSNLIYSHFDEQQNLKIMCVGRVCVCVVYFVVFFWLCFVFVLFTSAKHE